MITSQLLHPKARIVLRRAGEIKGSKDAFNSDAVNQMIKVAEANCELQDLLTKLVSVNSISPNDVERAAEIIAKA